ncbi:MAG: MHYT domain-containing protein [Burkholderiales bacterium]
MVGHHNYWLVLLSVIVSTTASYVALEAVSRVTEQRRRKGGWSWRRAERRRWAPASGRCISSACSVSTCRCRSPTT